ncbi:MAG TPA: LLM class flavin-dependent oxidoreductase [Acidimicrobiales bacterium]|nr:LLM class flavin-dependent oxidoreductase [Acidimicrobiales bacterium]
MKVGVILPTFRRRAEDALAAAADAESLGLDGVFCYDHLWPMGRPDRPALAPFPVLAAVASSTRRLAVGTLVARVGLVDNEVLLSQFDALAAVSPGRVVAGLGTGDHLSAAENVAYGVPFDPPERRRSALLGCIRELAARGVPVWVGSGSPRTVAVAEAGGAAVNLWDARPDVVAEHAARAEVTWAGPVPEGLAAHVAELAAAGATWAVFGWPVPLAELAAARRDVAPLRRR